MFHATSATRLHKGPGLSVTPAGVLLPLGHPQVAGVETPNARLRILRSALAHKRRTAHRRWGACGSHSWWICLRTRGFPVLAELVHLGVHVLWLGGSQQHRSVVSHTE